MKQLLVGLLLLSLWPALRAAPVEALLVAADDAELRSLLGQMHDTKIEQRASWTFWTGTLAGRTVVLTRTEGDPLNAVAATTLAIRHYSPRLVITFGSSRAHDPSLRAGDVVVSGSFAAFDGMVSNVTPADGGSDSTKWIPLPHLLMTRGEKAVPVMSFAADPPARDVAARLKAPRGRVVTGVLGSANQVNREVDRIAWLRAHWGTSCEDGESAHVAGCAQLLGVPVVGWRVIDANAGEAAGLVPGFLEAWK